MNESINNAVKPAATYRPRLAYYHANPRGTGAVVQFELHPAHDNVDGSIFASFARQKTTGGMNGGVRTFATFDWQNRVTVKLDISDLSQMLQVFRGMQESIADGRGLFHNMERGSTVIRLEHRIEPVTGYLFEVSRKLGEGDAVRIGVMLSPTEALGLSLAMEQSMGVIAFGIPMVVARNHEVRPAVAPSPVPMPANERPQAPARLLPAGVETYAGEECPF